MGDVINLRPPLVMGENPNKPNGNVVWECSCGGQKFYLLPDGEIECTECKANASSKRWFDPTA